MSCIWFLFVFCLVFLGSSQSLQIPGKHNDITKARQEEKSEERPSEVQEKPNEINKVSPVEAAIQELPQAVDSSVDQINIWKEMRTFL